MAKKKTRVKGAGRGRRPQTVKKRVRKTYNPTVAPSMPSSGVERVLALDISSVCCGWSVFDNGQLHTYGKYKQVGEGHGERMLKFAEWIFQMLESWNPTHFIYEAPYAGPRKHAFSVLIRYAGVAQMTYFRWKGEELPEDSAVPANIVKKLIGAKKGKNHEANKKIVLLMVNQRYSLSLKYKAKDPKKTISQDDEADAIAVNWAWHVKYRNAEGGDDEVEA